MCRVPTCIDVCRIGRLEGSPFDITACVVTRLSLTPFQLDSMQRHNRAVCVSRLDSNFRYRDITVTSRIIGSLQNPKFVVTYVMWLILFPYVTRDLTKINYTNEFYCVIIFIPNLILSLESRRRMTLRKENNRVKENRT